MRDQHVMDYGESTAIDFVPGAEVLPEHVEKKSDDDSKYSDKEILLLEPKPQNW